MGDVDQPEYYRRRELAERALAHGATDKAIASIHLDMAARYAELSGPISPVLRIAP